MVPMMNEAWDKLLTQLDKSTKELNSFLEGGVSAITLKRLQKFVDAYNKLGDAAQRMEESIKSPIDPVEVTLPWPDPEFKDLWNYWKDYLLESHNITYKSRRETKVLDYLYDIAEGRLDNAVRYLNYAMAGGYGKFFRVEEKNYGKPTNASNNADSDF